jgi:hypothetical protein
MTKKNDKEKTKGERKQIEYKTIEERKSDVKNIIKELTKFELTPKYTPIKKLYSYFKDFIDNGNHIKVNIPFPMINRRIKGDLMPNKKADSTICLIHENFNK